MRPELGRERSGLRTEPLQGRTAFARYYALISQKRHYSGGSALAAIQASLLRG